MDPDEHVCLCFRVSLRKLVTFMEVTRPSVPSQLSDCQSAGTGCHWCVPFLNRIHDQWQRGERVDLTVSPARYAERRARFRSTGERPPVEEVLGDAGEAITPESPSGGRPDRSAG